MSDNEKQALLAELAMETLRKHADAPRVSAVSFDCYYGKARVKAQLWGPPLEAVAGWAAALGVPVKITPEKSHVQIWAELTTVTSDGKPAVFEAWDHITHAEAFNLIGEMTTDTVELTPETVLAGVDGES